MIIVENLSKSFGTVSAVKNASFSVKDGDILGFIGPNGAGKSTTINCIMGLVRPTSGSVTVLGQDATTNGAGIRADVGFLPSDDNLPARLTGLQHLEFVCKTRGMPTDRIEELAKRLEVPLNRKIKTLSAGNRKKIGIIAAVCTNPKVIVLDEPTATLDPIMQRIVFEILTEQSKMGACILFSTHILSEVSKICTRVAVIKKGEIVSIEDGENFKMRQIKDVRLELDYATVTKKTFTLDGIKNLTIEGNIVTFDYNGDINKLVEFLNAYAIVNLEIKDVDIEKTFMRYYE